MKFSEVSTGSLFFYYIDGIKYSLIKKDVGTFNCISLNDKFKFLLSPDTEVIEFEFDNDREYSVG